MPGRSLCSDRKLSTLALVLAVAAIVQAAAGCSNRSDTSNRGPVDRRPLAANLAEARGDVRWRAAAAAAWSRARVGQGLRPDDAVQTMAEGEARVCFTRGAAVQLGPNTTLRIPDQPPEVARVQHVSGRLLARIDPGRASRMEVELPPGTLYLGESAAAAAGGLTVEAQVDIDGPRIEVAMIKGTGRLERPNRESLSVAEHAFVQVDQSGQVLAAGRVGARVEAVSPADGANIKTRGEVAFRWRPAPEAEGYRIEIRPARGSARELFVAAGIAEAAVALDTGSYQWQVAALQGGEPMPPSPPRALGVEVDRTAPMLDLSSPLPGETTSRPTIRVVGRTEPGALLEIDGRSSIVAADGSFSVDHPLGVGLTNLVVRVADDLGNARAVSRTVLRE